MKIIHTASGKAYQLSPDTQLEIERPNLFFNDYGEQTLPVDLPDTDLNRELMGYPDIPANRNKPQADISCTIQDGDYCMAARQAVLGAKRKEKITTTFYMNEGSFLSRIEKTSVASIFGTEIIPGIETVQQGIDWCWSLRDNQDEHFAIFPTIVDLDGERRGVNIISLMDKDGNPCVDRWSGSLPSGYTYGLFHAFNRKETVNGQIINLSPGYYITPFIRANYLLERIFSYFGYTLQDNFFMQTEPFKHMVFINTTTDALVNGTILLAHLVPDCLCSTILELFRKKFCCEFISDEVAHTVRIEFFKDIMAEDSLADLTARLTGYPEISFQAPKQLKIFSKESLTEGNTFESTCEIEQKYPSAYYDMASGRYKRNGYSLKTVVEHVSDGNLPYYAAEEGFEDYEVTVPDCQFYLSSIVYFKNSSYGVSELRMTAPYVGDGRTLNSTIKGLSSESGESRNGADDPYLTSTSHSQSPILAFIKEGEYYSSGSNHDVIHGYSLLYNGSIGIYEKFYRDFDNLLRNSLHKVTVPLLLTDQLKQSLPVHGKVNIKNTEYLIDILKYTIGGKNTPIETTLLTTRLFEPISIALSESERMPQETNYRWVLQKEETSLTEEEWIAAGYEKGAIVSFPPIYPPSPTKEQYEAGGKYYERYVYYSYKSLYSESIIYSRYYTYLSVELYSSEEKSNN